MSAYIVFNFLIYCVINAFTPGPGNILAMNTVANYGWKNGRPLYFGIFAGYFSVQLICALFVYGIGTFLPDILEVLKYVGAAYISLLAIKIAISKPDETSSKTPASFLKGFILQFINIKIYMFGITALTGYITGYSMGFSVLLGAEMFIVTIGTVATLTWIGIGIIIQKFYVKHYRVIDIIMALTLIECIWSIIKN